MSRAHAFANDLCRELRRRDTGHEWIAGWPQRSGHEKADAAGVPPSRSKSPLVLVEVELRRISPSTNVLKVWKWIEDNKLRKWLPDRKKCSVILVQAFSKYYRRKEAETANIANAQFIGSQMKKVCGVNYVPLLTDYNPRKHGKKGAGRRHYHAVELAGRIARFLRRARNQRTS